MLELNRYKISRHGYTAGYWNTISTKDQHLHITQQYRAETTLVQKYPNKVNIRWLSRGLITADWNSRYRVKYQSPVKYNRQLVLSVTHKANECVTQSCPMLPSAPATVDVNSATWSRASHTVESRDCQHSVWWEPGAGLVHVPDAVQMRRLQTQNVDRERSYRTTEAKTQPTITDSDSVPHVCHNYN